MITSAKGIAAAVAGLVSLSVVGAALANEPEDPTVVEPVEQVATCPDLGTDEGTTDEGTTDEGTTDEGTEPSDPDDECESTDGTDDEGTDDSDDDGIDELEQPSEAVESDEVEALEEDGERPQNHGWYVSEATKTCPESGRERGECISAVAKSDLGKPHADADGATAGDDEGEASVEEADDTGDRAPAKAAKSSKGGGKAKGGGAKG